MELGNLRLPIGCCGTPRHLFFLVFLFFNKGGFSQDSIMPVYCMLNLQASVRITHRTTRSCADRIDLILALTVMQDALFRFVCLERVCLRFYFLLRNIWCRRCSENWIFITLFAMKKCVHTRFGIIRCDTLLGQPTGELPSRNAIEQLPTN